MQGTCQKGVEKVRRWQVVDGMGVTQRDADGGQNGSVVSFEVNWSKSFMAQNDFLLAIGEKDTMSDRDA